MKKRGCLALAIATVIAAVVLLLLAVRAVWIEQREELLASRSPEVIEAELLAATPLGSDVATVRKYVQDRWGYKVKAPPKEGFRVVSSEGYSERVEPDPPRTVIRVTCGHYCPDPHWWGCIFYTVVDATYLFGRDQKLESIHVTSSTY
jgi:hypothetical protein